MPNSIRLFEWLALLATVFGVGLDTASWLMAHRQQTGAFVIRDVLVVSLELGAIWMIAHRRSNLLRWGWIGVTCVSAVAVLTGFINQPDDFTIPFSPLEFVGYGLILTTAFALLMADSRDWCSAMLWRRAV